MRLLQSLLLIVTLAICYLVFFRSQATGPRFANDGTRTDQTETSEKGDTRPATAHSQYKVDMDRAHVAAEQMKASHKEADSF